MKVAAQNNNPAFISSVRAVADASLQPHGFFVAIFPAVEALDSRPLTGNLVSRKPLSLPMAKKQSRCWPGYEPVPGKAQHEQGSCRPEAKSKLSADEKEFRAKRRKQLDKWQAEHPNTRKSAAQHLHAPGKSATAAKKRVVKKTGARRGEKTARSQRSKVAD